MAYRRGRASQTTVKTLFALSRNQCAHPQCENELTNSKWREVAADIAHIRGERPGAPRYDASMTEPQRWRYDNLILLCPRCHRLIDRLEPDAYPVERLVQIKTAHEERAEAAKAWATEAQLRDFSRMLLRQVDVNVGEATADSLAGLRDIDDSEVSKALFGSESRGRALQAVARLANDFTTGEVARAAGLPAADASRQLSALERAGLLERVGKHGGRWVKKPSRIWHGA